MNDINKIIQWGFTAFAITMAAASMRGCYSDRCQLELEKVKLQVEGLKYVAQIKQAELQLTPKYPITTWYHTNVDLLYRETKTNSLFFETNQFILVY